MIRRHFLDADRASFERKILWITTLLVTAAVLFTARLALAQDVAVPVDPDAELAALATKLLEAITHGQWWIAAGIVVSGLTTLIRNGLLTRIPGKVGQFLQTNPAVGFSLPLILAGVGGVVTAIASGQPFSASMLLVEVLKVAAMATFTFLGLRNVAEARTVGKAAADKVDAKPIALVELSKPSAVPPSIAPISEAEKAAALDRLK